ncbi:low molecular weight phosphotyrosine protein phosphatase-like [Oppia nitens]|uniref:low molecular weight phosphotyrosine protein phosphatase-like n=1 Tax=Oppia nitens TaxID=1686743 RepID=UPI0023D9F50A|nr:low molecular weight phosphotyrosine protein phosphatase-like [Oppia nitens]
MSEKRGVLFVCLGNICRSPIAEAVFAHVVKQRDLTDQWFTDSAATGSWHTGSLPDSRARTVLRRHDIETDHRARQLCKQDFDKYDYIFGMDDNNIDDINGVKPKNSKAVVELLGKYDPQKQTIIEDPYYQRGDKGFETNYEQCLRSCNAFLDQFHK